MRTSSRCHCFHYTAVKTWNNIQVTVWSIETLGTVRKQLKTHLFKLSFVTSHTLTAPTNSLLRTVCIKFNLLTYNIDLLCMRHGG